MLLHKSPPSCASHPSPTESGPAPHGSRFGRRRSSHIERHPRDATLVALQPSRAAIDLDEAARAAVLPLTVTAAGVAPRANQ